VLNRQTPDRLPFNFWMDRSIMAELDRKFGENFRVTHYGADVIETFPAIPFFAEFAANVEYKVDERTTWVMRHPAESIVQLKNSPMPDADDPACYACIKADRKKYPDKALFALVPTPLEILFGQVGMEQLFYDIADYDDLMDEILEDISQTQLKAVDHIADCDMDVLYLAGDICSTKSELLSCDMLRRFCFEPLHKLVKRAHQRGLKVFFHTDGHVMNILPLFVEFGIDGINPFQVSAGNSFETLRDEYGGKLMLYGGIDNCFIIPGGTVEDVRAHIRHLFETLGQTGGLIASSHDIPSHVPLENLDAMVEAIKACRY
jgi:uroporphyrinogen decarboxylase